MLPASCPRTSEKRRRMLEICEATTHTYMHKQTYNKCFQQCISNRPSLMYSFAQSILFLSSIPFFLILSLLPYLPTYPFFHTFLPSFLPFLPALPHSHNLVLYEITVCLADASSGIRIPAVGTPESPTGRVAVKGPNHLPPQVWTLNPLWVTKQGRQISV